MTSEIPYSTLPDPLSYPFLAAAPEIVHATFSRHGGISPPPWNSLNVGFDLGDLVERVEENRARLKQALGIEVLLSARQIHSDRVYVLQETLAADRQVEGFDALVTDRPGVGLLIQQADCQAVLLADPENRAVGIAHSGWRGSAANIIGATVRTMVEVFGSRPGALLAAISPSLGPCCAEFVNYQRELPESFHAYQVRPGYFDFWAISGDQLRAAGVRDQNIKTAGRCTVCSPEYFSYRRDRQTGRFASIIGLRGTSAADQA